MKRIALLALVGLSVALAQNARADAKLNVGDPAPAMKVAKWVKGQPVNAFETGKVYVVEFWATWCGPCRATIPHLTELAKKYKGKVTFAGISVSEEEPEKVPDFVKQMGAKMDYNVGMDDKKAIMSKTWMDAAGQNGIPCAFVVDKTKKIAWIGHPMEMDGVLKEVLGGKFDSKAFAAKQRKEREAREAAQRKDQEIFSKLTSLLRSEKYTEALAEMDRIIASNAKYERNLALPRFNILLKTDEEKAYPYARKLAEGVYKDEAMALNNIAWQIVDDNSKLKSPDYEVALFVAERASELTKHEEPMILDTLAYAHFKKGNVDKAIETQEKAVKLLEKAADADENMKKELTERLKMMKEKKQ